MTYTGFVTTAPLATRLHSGQAKCARSAPFTRGVRMMADDKKKNPLAGLGGKLTLV